MPPSIDYEVPVGFFDRALKNTSCGAGMLLYIKSDHKILLKMGVATESNTKSELLSLWALLRFVLLRGLIRIQIYGDSKAIIDWFSGLHDI